MEHGLAWKVLFLAALGLAGAGQDAVPPAAPPPATEPGAEPAVEPAVEPVPEPAAESATEPAPPEEPAIVIDPLAAEYFALCDHDANGWISFREARACLAMERAEYRLYDGDRDGRVFPEEFQVRYALALERAGGFRAPVLPPAVKPPDRRTPEQIRNAYDRDSNRVLDRAELAVLLSEHGITDASAAELLALFDHDRSGGIDAGPDGEHVAITAWLDARRGARFWNLPRVEAQSVIELFGAVVARRTPSGIALPSQIVGPVPHFYRLDFDRDGRVSSGDLLQLEAPLQLGVHASAVLAALDQDGDLVLDERELLLALEARPRSTPRRVP